MTESRTEEHLAHKKAATLNSKSGTHTSNSYEAAERDMQAMIDS